MTAADAAEVLLADAAERGPALSRIRSEMTSAFGSEGDDMSMSAVVLAALVTAQVDGDTDRIERIVGRIPQPTRVRLRMLDGFVDRPGWLS